MIFQPNITWSGLKHPVMASRQYERIVSWAAWRWERWRWWRGRRGRARWWWERRWWERRDSEEQDREKRQRKAILAWVHMTNLRRMKERLKERRKERMLERMGEWMIELSMGPHNSRNWDKEWDDDERGGSSGEEDDRVTEVLLAWGVGHVKDKLDRVVPRPREERNLQNEYSQVILCRLLTY